MAQISLREWDRLMSAGTTTYAVGPVTSPHAVFVSRAEAEQAAALLDGTFIQWDGPHGHQFTAPDLDVDAWMDREPEAGA